MEALQRVGKGVQGNQHVLDDLMLLIHPLDCLALRQFQKRDLGWYHPSEQQAEHWIVAKRNNVLKVQGMDRNNSIETNFKE